MKISTQNSYYSHKVNTSIESLDLHASKTTQVPLPKIHQAILKNDLKKIREVMLILPPIDLDTGLR